MVKQPIGLAIAFTIALSLMTHQPTEEPLTSGQIQNQDPIQTASPAQVVPAIPAHALSQPQATPDQEKSEPQQLETEPLGPTLVIAPQEQESLDEIERDNTEQPSYRIASLVPGVERLLKTATGN